jgi:prepilin-type N-terminal cleavage/methylation domain-containing protein
MTPAMSGKRAGFTLVEMLVALLVLGLAMAALAQATRVFSKTSSRTVATATAAGDARRIERFLARSLGPGPFADQSSQAEPFLQGDAQHLTFDCGAAAPCSLAIEGGERPRLVAAGVTPASIALPRADLSFRYVSGGGMSADFPEGDASAGLTGIALVDGRGDPVAMMRFTVAQSADCAYDDVNHRCFPRQEGKGP